MEIELVSMLPLFQGQGHLEGMQDMTKTGRHVFKILWVVMSQEWKIHFAIEAPRQAQMSFRLEVFPMHTFLCSVLAYFPCSHTRGI